MLQDIFAAKQLAGHLPSGFKRLRMTSSVSRTCTPVWLTLQEVSRMQARDFSTTPRIIVIIVIVVIIVVVVIIVTIVITMVIWGNMEKKMETWFLGDVNGREQLRHTESRNAGLVDVQNVRSCFETATSQPLTVRIG